MPGFFDFTSPNSPISGTDDPSWMGSILGQDAPIAPPTNDIFGIGGGEAFDSTSVPNSNVVPYDALAAMNGIGMPQLPSVDQYGRYGVNDAQRASAGNQAFSNVLMGAAGSFFGGGPEPALRAGAQAGQIQSQMLDKYSAQNIANYKLQVEAKAKELDFISKKSDIAKQQMVMEAEQMKLDSLKQTKAIAAEFGRQMAPVAAETLAKARELYPDKVDGIQRGFLTAQALLAQGDLAGADAQYDTTMQQLPSEWRKDMEEKMFKQTIAAATKFGMGLEAAQEMAKNPDFIALGLSFEVGQDGTPQVITQRELQERKLKDEYLKSQTANMYANAAESRARGDYYASGGGGGGKGEMTETAAASLSRDIDVAIETLNMQPPLDVTKRPAWEAAQAKAKGILAANGLADPNAINSWKAMDPMAKRAAVGFGRGGAKATASATQPAMPQVAPVSAGGGAQGFLKPQVAGAMIKWKNQPNRTPEDTMKVIQALVSKSQDPSVPNIYKQVATQFPGDPEAQLDALIKAYTVGKISPNRTR